MLKGKLLKSAAVLETICILGSFSAVSAEQQEKDLGPWSFFVGKTFNYDNDGGAVPKYYNTDDFSYTAFERTNLGGSSDGICYSTAESGTDANWQNWLSTFPNSADNRFYVQPPQGFIHSSEIGAKFDVPENGLWVIECDALNKGTSEGIGGSNAVRICVLEPEEKMETSDNSVDLNFRKRDSSADGYYKSDVTPLSAGSRIMMRVSAGKDRWGDAFYISYKIHKVNVKGEILETYDLNQAGVKTRQVFVPSAERIGNVACNNSEWKTKPQFGPWDFFICSQFYKRDTYQNAASYLYYSENENPYDSTEPYLTKNQAVYAGVLNAPISWPGVQSKYNREGIVIASNTGSSGDNNWRSAMEIYPGSMDKSVRFIPGPSGLNVSGGSGVAVRFKVPVSGNYRIHTNIKNYGWYVNEAVGYGDSNLARISVLKGSEDVQTEANSAVFEIPRKTAQGDSYDSGVCELSAGDRIYLEVYNGDWGNLDDFIGNYIIDRYNDNGEIEESYNLGDVSFTDTGSWNMFYSSQGETNQLKYVPLIPASGSALSSSAGYYNYASKVTTYWGAADGKVTMADSAPSFGWNSNDTSIACRMLDTDMILSYDVKKSGTYNISAAAQLISGSAANVTVSKTDLFTGLDTDITETVLAEFTAENAEIKKDMLVDLNEGERVYFKLSKDNTDTETIVRLSPAVNEAIEETFVYSGGIQVTVVNTLVPGSKIDVIRTAKTGKGKMAVALYEQQPEGAKLKKVSLSDGSGTEFKSYFDSIVIPVDSDAAKTFMKVMILDFDSMTPNGEVKTY